MHNGTLIRIDSPNQTMCIHPAKDGPCAEYCDILQTLLPVMRFDKLMRMTIQDYQTNPLCTDVHPSSKRWGGPHDCEILQTLLPVIRFNKSMRMTIQDY